MTPDLGQFGLTGIKAAPNVTATQLARALVWGIGKGPALNFVRLVQHEIEVMK